VAQFLMSRVVHFLVDIRILVFTLMLPYVTLASAGIYRQFYSPNGNYRVDILNIHSGWAGPWPETQNIDHTNIHVYKKNGSSWREIANYHVSAKTNTASGIICYYIYEKKSNWSSTNCKPNYDKQAAQNEMQQKLKDNINTKTNYEMYATVAAVVAVAIIVWITFPYCILALA